MGGYCRYCDLRCFVLRVLNDGQTMLLATCRAGAQHDLTSCGETFETACNPVKQPRRAARLGLLRQERSCYRHEIANCGGGDCRTDRRRLRADADAPGVEDPDPLEVAAAGYPRLTWAGHGRPDAAVFWGFRSADPMDFLSVRPLVGRAATSASYPAAAGMICEGDRVSGVVIRADDRGIKVSWSIENTVQNYTWPEVEEYGFTFRRAD